jgi:hypothetical protein
MHRSVDCVQAERMVKETDGLATITAYSQMSPGRTFLYSLAVINLLSYWIKSRSSPPPPQAEPTWHISVIASV